MKMSIDTSKIRLFERKIMDFWRKAGREHLPWRRDGITAYEVWVSEIMLQQTQVSRVIEYYERFLKRFPTVQDLAVASWEEFLPYYAGLGYYRRGRNMIEAAKKVVAEHGGEFPRDKKLLMKLPGVGDYTASAILSFAYGDNHLAWDTNLKRVIGRFFFGSKGAFELGKGSERDFSLVDESAFRARKSAEGIFSSPVVLTGVRTKKAKKKCASVVFPPFQAFESVFESSKKDLNAALMDFGSAVCTGRPKCNVCPLQKECQYFLEQGEQEVKVKEESKIASGVDWKEAQVLVWLHENHKQYYSSHPKHFEPFVIPATHNTRAGIKAYFKERYGLELAVRPPHKKHIVGDKPTLFVNAQILLGETIFVMFPQDEVRQYAKQHGW